MNNAVQASMCRILLDEEIYRAIEQETADIEHPPKSMVLT